jgi:hypothetical protein
VPYCRFTVKFDQNRAERFRGAKAIFGIAVEVEEISPNVFQVFSRESNWETAKLDFEFLKSYFEDCGEVMDAKMEKGYRKSSHFWRRE